MNNVEIDKNPYLTIIISSRNDDHGGNMMPRMKTSLAGLLEQLENHHIESELILVEWNPPADKPLLKDILKWPDDLEYCTIRHILVPPAIHRRYKYSDKIPMIAVVAVNCGIRRARGQFILPGVIDLIYSEELMAHIASRSLKIDERYRVDRCDVDRNVINCQTLKERLEFCRQHIIRINSNLHNGDITGLPDLHTNACGDFQLMSQRYWHMLRGYREADIIAAHVDSLLSYASYAAGVREVFLSDPIRVYHIDHDEKYNDRLKMRRPHFEDRLESLNFIPRYFRDKILRFYRNHVDSRTEVVEVNGIPTLDYPSYIKMCWDILVGKKSFVLNGRNWGLGNQKLPETIVFRAKWETQT